MAFKLSRREYVLLALLGLVAVVILYMNRGPGRASGDATSDRIAELMVGEPPVVHIDRLAAEVEAYDPQGRNLFKYYTPPPPRATPRPVTTPPPRPAPRPTTRPQVARQRNPQPAGPRPPSIDFTYLGFLGPKHNKIAVFEDGQNLLLARSGDVLREQFRIVDFGYESIVIGYVDNRFKDETTELKQKKKGGGR